MDATRACWVAGFVVTTSCVPLETSSKSWKAPTPAPGNLIRSVEDFHGAGRRRQGNLVGGRQDAQFVLVLS